MKRAERIAHLKAAALRRCGAGRVLGTATGARRLAAEAAAQAGVGGGPQKAFGAVPQIESSRQHLSV
jgi:hypothetical protein